MEFQPVLGSPVFSIGFICHFTLYSDVKVLEEFASKALFYL